jgi:hypothetical protein
VSRFDESPVTFGSSREPRRVRLEPDREAAGSTQPTPAALGPNIEAVWNELK